MSSFITQTVITTTAALILAGSIPRAEAGSPEPTGGQLVFDRETFERAPSVYLTGEQLAAGGRALRTGGFQIVIVPGVNLQANPVALAAAQRAADDWEGYFSDPATIRIAIELQDFPPGTGAGAITVPKFITTDYATLRTLMVNDSANEDDDGIIASMPIPAIFFPVMPAGFSWDGNVQVTKATMAALGVTGLDVLTGSTGYGQMIVDISDVPWDFDSSDGVPPGTYDFQGVIAHEIGHALGFDSSVQAVVAALAASQPPGPLPVSSLDLFRFTSAGPYDPGTAFDFGHFARNVENNVDDSFDDTSNEYRMSTGGNGYGDGYQASHWKQSTLNGSKIGIMDPVATNGVVETIEYPDVRALDLMGFDYNHCGDGVVGPGEQCDDEGRVSGDCCDANCQFEAGGACNDSVFCNGADTCSLGLCTIHAGDPCASGSGCNNVCNEAADNCLVANGTSCSSDSNVCTSDICASGNCTHPGNGLPCNDGLFCTGTDTCSGGSCAIHSGDPCTGGGVCNDTCNESADSCVAPDTSPCDDGMFCNGADSCTAGLCTGHAGDPCSGGEECADLCNEIADSCHRSDTTPCSDDGGLCTDDFCDGAGACAHTHNPLLDPSCDACAPAPLVGCVAAAVQGLSISNSSDNSKDKLVWKWVQGEQVDVADFGTPDVATHYRFCVYSRNEFSDVLLAGAAVENPAGWTNKGSKWIYGDSAGSQGGVTKMKLAAGSAATSSIKLLMKGASSILPGPTDMNYFFVSPGIVVTQLQNSDGHCWGAALVTTGLSSNDSDKVKVTDKAQYCGDEIREFGEPCDGADDAACPALCVDCSCP